jgi:hypothetical protein
MKAATRARAGPKRSAVQETNLAGRQKELRLTDATTTPKERKHPLQLGSGKRCGWQVNTSVAGREIHRLALERHRGGMLFRLRQ